MNSKIKSNSEVFSKSFTYAAEFNKLFLSMMIIIILVVYFIIILFSLLSFYGEECASLPAKGRCLLAVHVEKSFPNLNKSNRTQIVFTMQRLIWNSKRTVSVCCSKSIGAWQIQSDFGLIWFDMISKRFLSLQLSERISSIENSSEVLRHITALVSRGGGVWGGAFNLVPIMPIGVTGSYQVKIFIRM